MSVGTTFDEATYDPSDFQECDTGSPSYDPYVVIHLACSSSINGKYVSVSLAGTRKLYLTNVRVLTSLCKSFIVIKVILDGIIHVMLHIFTQF